MLLNENASDVPVEEGFLSPMLSLDTLIESNLEQAALQVMSETPDEEMETFSSANPPVIWDPGHVARLALPADWLRLVAVKMSDWSSEVKRALRPEDAGWVYRESIIEAISGTARRPRAYLTIDVGGRSLELHRCESDSAQLEYLIYVARPKVSATARTISFPAGLRRRVAERAAELTREIIRKSLGSVSLSVSEVC